MADAPKAKPSSPWMDLLWFLGIMAGFFILWVWGGGPERARQNPPSPIINGTTNIAPGSNQNYNNPSSPGTSNPGSNPTSGQIQVTPL